MDDRAGRATLKTDGINPGEEMVVDKLKKVNIDKTKSGLDDSEDHIRLFMLAFEEKENVDDVIHDVSYLLTVLSSLEHFLLPLYFFLLYYFDK